MKSGATLPIFAFFRGDEGAVARRVGGGRVVGAQDQREDTGRDRQRDHDQRDDDAPREAAGAPGRQRTKASTATATNTSIR